MESTGLYWKPFYSISESYFPKISGNYEISVVFARSVYPLKGYVDASDAEECVKGTVRKKKAQVTDLLFGTITAHQIGLIKDWISSVSKTTAAALITGIGVNKDQFLTTNYLALWVSV